MALDYVEAKQVGAPGGYRSTRALTLAVLILLGLHAFLSLMLSFGWPAALKLLEVADQDLSAGSVGIGDAIAGIAVGVGTYLQIGVFIACATCFLCWLYRAYSNLPSLGSESVLTTPKAAVTGWFIPFANLVHGYRSMHNLYLESQRPAVLPDGYVLPTRAAIVGWWWGLYLARNISIRIADRALDRFTHDGLSWFWIAAALDIAAAILCMMVVYRVDKRQRDQHEDQVRRSQAPVPTGATLR